MTTVEPEKKRTRRESDAASPAREARASLGGSDWTLPDHTANVRHAIDKDLEGASLHKIVNGKIDGLQGLGEVAQEMMEAVGVHTVRDLAEWKFGRWARAIVTLAALEETGHKRAPSSLNIDLALDKEHETKTFNEMLALPVSSLQGLSAKADEALRHHHVDTIEKLGKWKYLEWATALSNIVDAEETLSPSDRKLDRQLKKLDN